MLILTMHQYFISSLFTICIVQICSSYVLTTSSSSATIGKDFNLTCYTNSSVLIFRMNESHICVIDGLRSNGSCYLLGTFISDYIYICDKSLNKYTVRIPGNLMVENMHLSRWTCEDPFGGGISNTVTLYVNVPVSNVTITAINNSSLVQIVEGTMQQFVCTTDVWRPVSRIQFYINNINITANSTQTDTCVGTCSNGKYTSTSTLAYTGKLNDDAKVIFCTASNDVEGQDVVKSMNLTISILYGPQQVYISPSIKLYTINETDSIGAIYCAADCRPSCMIAWEKPNGFTNTSVLNLQNIERNQTGNYTCRASNIIGSRTSITLSIIVNYGPKQVYILPPTQSYTVNETGSINIIHCTADCNPACKLRWNGPNIPLNTTSLLYLRNMDRKQTGNYTCRASNIVGSSTSIVLSIIVNYGPRQVNIYPLTQSYTVNEKGSVDPIGCSADCKPACTMTWSGPNLAENTTSVLNLQNIDRNQAGTYQCTARNFMNNFQSVTVVIIVNYGPQEVNIYPSTYSYNVNETDSIGPISCITDCKPTCTMLWKRQNFVVSSTSVLNLQSIDRSKTGIYSCTASNIVGSSASNTVNIIVNYIPVVNSLSGNKTVKENETISIVCTYNSVPIPDITWKFNNTPFTNEDVHIQTNSRFSKLVLPNATCLSMGIYTCEARNILGKGSKVFEVDVLCIPRIHPKDDSLLAIAIREYEPINITALIIAFPEPVFYWRLVNNISTLNITNGITNKQLGRNMFSSRLFISSVSRSDFGHYYLYAQNGVGSGIVFINSYHVISANKPDAPEAIFVACYSAFATVIWKSLFNGGSEQTFTVRYWVSETSTVESSSNILDSGENSYQNITLHNLVPGQGYSFLVVAINKFGQSSSKMLTCISSVLPDKLQDSQDNKTVLNAGIGLVVLSVLLILVVVSIVLIYRIRLKKQPSKNSRSDTYMDISTQNPVFSNTYDTLNNKNNTAETVQKSNDQATSGLNNYEEFKTKASKKQESDYQNLKKYKQATKKKTDRIYANLDI